MKKSLLFYILTFIALNILFGLESCSKSSGTCNDGIWNQNETGVDCGGSCRPCNANEYRIKTLSDRNGLKYSYTYDSLGRISSYSNVKYIYSNDSVIPIYNGSVNYIYSLLLNINGFLKIKKINDLRQNVTFTWKYTYDNDGHVLTSKSEVDDNIYSWTNGNLTTAISKTLGIPGSLDTNTYTYLSTKDNTIGNENFGEMYLGKSSKNLVETHSQGGMVLRSYTYEYDALKRVVKSKLTMQSFIDSTMYTYY